MHLKVQACRQTPFVGKRRGCGEKPEVTRILEVVLHCTLGGGLVLFQENVLALCVSQANWYNRNLSLLALKERSIFTSRVSFLRGSRCTVLIEGFRS